MKKRLFVLGIGVLVGAVAGIVFADILTNNQNPHNFSVTNTGTVDVSANVARVCDFCHTPHGARTVAPLWNRTDPVNAYTAYSDPQGTIDAGDLDTTLGAQSLGCMSCHDGSTGQTATALDSLYNYPNAYPAAANILFSAETGGRIDAATNPPYEYLASGPALLSNDLSDDHPVGFTNPGPGGDPDLKALDPAYHFGGGNNQVECASCHNPHDYGTGNWLPFLRETMADSALCGVCHDK